MKPLALLATLVACTGSVPPEQFAAALADAQCSALSRCLPQAPYLDAQCRAQVKAHFGEDVPRAVAAGRIRYNGAQARECVDAFASAACAPGITYRVDSSPCSAALEGTVATGAECSSYFECASGVCLGFQGACPSRCEGAPGPGEPCSAHGLQPCDERQNLTCTDGVCRRLAPAGAACASDFECSVGFVCAGGVCSSLRRAFAGCVFDESCAPGLFCAGSGADATGVCLVRGGAGAPCARTDDLTDAALRGAECATGFACVGAGRKTDGAFVPGTCTPIAFAGGRCREEGADMQVQITGCADGLICGRGTCVEPPENGPCAPHDVCKPGVAFCSAGTCVPVKSIGDPCSISPECAPGNVCDGVACVPDLPLCHEA